MSLPSELADIQAQIPSAILDIRYATTNNFTGKQLYEHPVAWLRHEPLSKLEEAVKELSHRLVIFDAFRPPEVQQILRSVVDDGNYVAEMSNHCKGITIDVTLADADGNYLDMGTEYDDFTEKAHPGTALISYEQEQNRAILKNALEKHGFVQHQYEWWHFDYMPKRQWSVIVEKVV